MRRLRASFPVLAALAAFLAFLPALDADFQDMDDAANLVDNPGYRGLGPAQLRWMFTAFLGGHYIPLTWMSFGSDYLLYGMAPWGYHLSNLLLHSANAALFFLLSLHLLKKALPDADRAALEFGALFAALHFGVHPLRAESVCWVTERRDVLCGFFFLCSALLHFRRIDREGRGGGAASLACFVLALLSKVSALALPVVLLAADACPLGRLPGGRGLRSWEAWGPLLREKLPYFALSAAAAAAAFIAQSHQQTGLISLEGLGLSSRLTQAFYGLTFYVRSTLWPGALSPMVELHPPLDLFEFRFAASAAGAAAVAAWGFLRLRRGKPALAAAILSYFAMIFPVLGFFQNGAQMVADRYSYLACLSWPLLAAGWLARRRAGAALGLVCAAYLLALGVRANAQARIWRDPNTLWDHALKLDPISSRANELGAFAAVKAHDWARAVERLERRQAVRPVYDESLSHWCSALVGLGRWEEAAAKCSEALRALPASDSSRRNLARSLNNLCARSILEKRLDEAERSCRAALEIFPDYASARKNLCGILTLRGRKAGADPYCR
jgi:tetratricopeptide (TPR) repeat protein